MLATLNIQRHPKPPITDVTEHETSLPLPFGAEVKNSWSQDHVEGGREGRGHLAQGPNQGSASRITLLI
jgi:hypothetical protein